MGKFTAADACVGYHLYIAALWPEIKAVIDAHPHVTKYMERLKARPAAIKANVFSFEG